MTQQILFLHGAGGFEEDGKLLTSLRNSLGDAYEIIYPHLPDGDSTTYDAWKDVIAAEIGGLDDGLIVLGHSFGGTVLLKYLSEENVTHTFRGLFLCAMPFWGAADWEVEEFTLRSDFADHLPDVPIFLYHCRDDEVVEFSHLQLYADKIPHATVRAIETGGHQFNDDMSPIASDIIQLVNAL